MAAPKKDNTLQARFGFADPEIKTEAHDQILFWVDRYAAEIATIALKLNARPKTKVRWEYVINTPTGGILGFVDLYIRVDLGEDRYNLFVEAKTEIKSLGELIRQVRMYQAGHTPDIHGGRRWLVISPETRFADKLEEQGIHFLPYDPTRTFSEIPV